MATTIDAAQCVSCGKLSYPTHFTCPACRGTKFKGVPVEGEGRLLTWTRAYALPLDYDDLYITLGIVEMDMGIRVTGRLDLESPQIGDRVRAGIRPVRALGAKEVPGLVFTAA
jgi:uncharacterized protein